MSEIRIVILDAMGVIYANGDDVADLLIPFARSHGCDLPDDEVVRLYRECSLGMYSSRELWQRLGVAGRTYQLNHEYLALHRLSPGLRPFLEGMWARQIPVACLSNDVAEWSLDLRRRHALDRLIGPWIISGEVGCRKPDPAIYEACLSALGTPADWCLFLDDSLKNLDAARAAGLQTAWFAPQAQAAQSNGHLHVASFEQVTRMLG